MLKYIEINIRERNYHHGSYKCRYATFFRNYIPTRVTGQNVNRYIYLNMYSSIPPKDRETDRQMDKWVDKQTDKRVEAVYVYKYNMVSTRING